jgi:predicted nucleic acid-binding protein
MPQINEAPKLPTAFAHSQSLRQAGLWLFVLHSKEITRMITKLPIRLLGDAVLRRNAWQYADRMGWEDTYTAEYVALTHLQGDALVTLDAELARSLEGVVATASIDALRTA